MNDKTPNPPGDASSAFDDGAFEEMIRTAMQSRPEEMPASDLAHRAMVLGRTEDTARATVRSARMARQRWWLQMTGLAATLLIVAMLAGVAHRLWTRGDIAAMTSSTSTTTDATTETTDGTASTTTTDADATSGASSTSSTARMIAIVFVAELLVLGVVLMTLSRRAPSMPFGAEAVAGFW